MWVEGELEHNLFFLCNYMSISWDVSLSDLYSHILTCWYPTCSCGWCKMIQRSLIISFTLAIVWLRILTIFTVLIISLLYCFTNPRLSISMLEDIQSPDDTKAVGLLTLPLHDGLGENGSVNIWVVETSSCCSLLPFVQCLQFPSPSHPCFDKFPRNIKIVRTTGEFLNSTE